MKKIINAIINSNIFIKVCIFIYFIMLFAISTIYLLVNSGLFFTEYYNIVTNVSNTLITIGISVFITYNISKSAFQKDSLEQQKLLARNSLDHSSSNSTHVSKLVLRISQMRKKVESKGDELYLQFLDEIIFSLDQINVNIISSQNDLKRLIKDEINEDNKIISELISQQRDILEKIDQMNDTANTIIELEENGENASSMIKDLKNEVVSLKKDLSVFEKKTQNEISNLKFGQTSTILGGGIGKSISLIDTLNNDNSKVASIFNQDSYRLGNSDLLSQKLDFHFDEKGNLIYDREKPKDKDK